MDVVKLEIAQFSAPPKDTGAASVFDRWTTAQPRRVALMGSFAPRKCGIATFTADIRDQLAEFHPHIGADVYALDDPSHNLTYAGVETTIACDDPASYRAAAKAINASSVDAVWLQHEYGIFGGSDGEMVLELVDRIAAPLIVTLHTVLSEPSTRQRAIIDRLAARASRIMVMAQNSRDLLVTQHNVDPARIAVIEHGAPDRPFDRREARKSQLGHVGKNVLMTFGLLGPGKGIERVIEALPAIVAYHPETVYRIVGATHPNLLAREGEAYRQRLVALAEELDVADKVQWEDRFFDSGELLDQLEECDIYLTPYPNLQQSTSGTLSYAVALGKAVVSTPYIHARELLGDGVGVLIEPNDTLAIARAVSGLLDDPERLAATQRRAYARGRRTIWPCFAEASADLIESVIAPTPATQARLRQPSQAAVFAMSDSTGMLQHAIGVVPDRRHGYCIDDNARALMLMHRLDSAEALEQAQVCAAFIQHAWNPDKAGFRNFMNFDRGWCEELGSEDSNGRAIWALGDVIANARDPGLKRWARSLYDIALPRVAQYESPRTLAFTILGACAVLETEPDHAPSRSVVERAAGKLFYLLDAQRRPAWTWFEAVLGYDNPRLSQALLFAGQALEREEWCAAGLATLRWIAGHQRAAEGHFRPVGSDSLGRADIPPLPFDQQPLEAYAAIDAAAAAWAVSGDPQWLDYAQVAWDWFAGANDRGMALGDPATGRCRDGLTPHGVNENCGAESILAYHMGYQSMIALAAHAADQTGERGFETDRTARAEPLAYT